jgi:hypothetical protein
MFMVRIMVEVFVDRTEKKTYRSQSTYNIMTTKHKSDESISIKLIESTVLVIIIRLVTSSNNS